VAREADLLCELSKRHDLKVVSTCVTLDPALQRALEPGAPTTEERLAMLASLARRGVHVGMLLAPVLPGLNDSQEQLSALCRRAKEAGVTTLLSQVLFLPDASKRAFFPWLAKAHPELHDRYVQSYRGRELAGPYLDVLRRRMERAREAAGFGAGSFR